jgi:hypothetical protein
MGWDVHDVRVAIVYKSLFYSFSLENMNELWLEITTGSCTGNTFLYQKWADCFCIL